MSKIKEQRKIFRINVQLPLCVQEKNKGTTVNLSEGGIAFILPEYLGNSAATIKITEDGKIFTSDVEILRKQQIPEQKWLYAGEFKSLRKEEMTVLRDLIFNALAEECLSRTKNWPYQEDVKSFICKELKEYLNELRKIAGTERSNELCNPAIVDKITNEIVHKGYLLEKRVDHKTLSQRIKGLFRMTAGHWAFQSKIMWHAYKKPRGYPGDYWLMEIIYDNKPVSESPLGRLFDLYYLNNPYAVAVRNRKDTMREVLKEIILSPNVPQPFRILNIACGSSREAYDLARIQSLRMRFVDWTFLDQDEEALNFCKNTAQMMPNEWRCKFVNTDILKLVENPSYEKSLGKQNLIYTIGLADYLPNRILKRLLHFCFFKLLAPGGGMIIAHKDEKEDPFAAAPPDWFCDWNFYPRCLDEFKEILVELDIPEMAMSEFWEPSHRIFFLRLNKPPFPS